MVVFDSTSLLFLLDPDTSPPIDTATGKPVDRCKERIEHYLANLSKKSKRIMIPTPVLSEILVGAGPLAGEYLNRIKSEYSFRLGVFDERAAVEVAYLTDEDIRRGRRLTQNETKAKVKYDRQIVAIAKVNRASVVCTNDKGLMNLANANDLSVIGLAELPLPPKDVQEDLGLDRRDDEP